MAAAAPLLVRCLLLALALALARSADAAFAQLSPNGWCPSTLSKLPWGSADAIVPVGGSAPSASPAWAAASLESGICVDMFNGFRAYFHHDQRTGNIRSFVCNMQCRDCSPDSNLFVPAPAPGPASAANGTSTSQTPDCSASGLVTALFATMVGSSGVSSIAVSTQTWPSPDVVMDILYLETSSCSTHTFNWIQKQRLYNCPNGLLCAMRDCTGECHRMNEVRGLTNLCQDGRVFLSTDAWAGPASNGPTPTRDGTSPSSSIRSAPSVKPSSRPARPSTSPESVPAAPPKSADGPAAQPADPDRSAAGGSASDSSAHVPIPTTLQNAPADTDAANSSSVVALVAFVTMGAFVIYRQSSARSPTSPFGYDKEAQSPMMSLKAAKTYSGEGSGELSFSQGDSIMIETAWIDGMAEAWNLTRDVHGMISAQTMAEYVEGGKTIVVDATARAARMPFLSKSSAALGDANRRSFVVHSVQGGPQERMSLASPAIAGAGADQEVDEVDQVQREPQEPASHPDLRPVPEPTQIHALADPVPVSIGSLDNYENISYGSLLGPSMPSTQIITQADLLLAASNISLPESPTK
ncbi:hypothetical protein BC831DRAFT_452239 [Entophlyctis helioformis]|nr:hypothetical protein BC831DRAFT_452239 [Entophlyctis helioformis]